MTTSPPLARERAAERRALPARSAPRARRIAVALVIALAALVAAVVASLSFGGRPSTFDELAHALLAPSGTVMDDTILGLRWPRTLTGLVVGACAGVAGVVIQGHTRNPLADPGLLGTNQGAALAIVASVALAGELPPLAQAGLAFVGALAATAFAFLVGAGSARGSTPVTLVLAGAAVAALCGGLVSAIVLLNEAALDTLRFWQVGSIAVRNGALEHVWPVAVAGLVLAFANIRALDALALGADTAASLGVDVRAARIVGVASVALLAASAVTVAGPIAFAGLLVPHVARAVLGPDHRWLVPAGAVLGAAVVLLADTAGRVIARPGELSVSVVLALVGTPFFVHLARRRRAVAL